MKKVVSLLSLLAVLIFAGIALAEDTDFIFEDDNGPVFYITLPDTWEGEWQEEDDLSVLHAMPKDESMYLSILAAYDATDPESSGAMVDAILTKIFKGYSFEKWEETTINGIRIVSSDSTATVKETGAEVQITAAYFVPKKDATYILYFFGPEEAFAKHEEEFLTILGSLRTKE